MVRLRASDPQYKVLHELALLLCQAHNPSLTGLKADLPEIERRALITVLEEAMAAALLSCDAPGARAA